MSLGLALKLANATLFKGVGRHDFRNGMPAGSTYTRTGAATALTLAGEIQSFAADAPQRTDRGLALEPSRTNLEARSADGTLWSASAVTVAESGVAYLPGGKRVVITDPAAAGAFNRIVAPLNISVVSGTAYRITLWYEVGTSNSLRLLFDGGGTTGITRATNGTWSAAGTSLGSMALLWDSAVSGTVRRAVIGWTPSGSATGAIGLGPNATGSDENQVFHGLQFEAGFATSPIITGAAAATRGLPVLTEPVPTNRSQALLTYADASTTLVTGLTPGGTFDLASAVIGAGKGLFGASELVTREWRS